MAPSFQVDSFSDDDEPAPTCSCLGIPIPKRTTSPETLPPWSRRVALLAFGVLQNGIAGGLLYGWASIDHTLLAAPLEQGGAGLTPRECTRLYSYAAGLSMVAALVLGTVLDYNGPRVASLLSCSIVAGGCFIFAMATKFHMFLIGLVLIAFGGPGIGNSIIHLANLFPGNENLAMSGLSGSIAFSFSAFAAFDSIWGGSDSITFRHLFGSMGAIVALLAIGSIVVYPDEPYEELVDDDFDDFFETTENTGLLKEPPVIERHLGDDLDLSPIRQYEATAGSNPADHHQKHSHHFTSPARATMVIEQPLASALRDSRLMAKRSDSFVASQKALRRGKSFLSLKDQPFVGQLTSGTYIRAVFAFVMCSFLTNFYVGTFTTELADEQTFDEQDRQTLAHWFTVIMSMGVVGSLVIGRMIDVIGLEVCGAITLVFGQLQMVLVLWSGDKMVAMMASFIAYALFRACLYPVFISSLTSKLGFKYFGILLGLGFALSGLAQLFFPSLVDAICGDCHSLPEGSGDGSCDSGHWQSFGIFQLSLFVAMLILPLLEYHESKTQLEKIVEILNSNSPVPWNPRNNNVER